MNKYSVGSRGVAKVVRGGAHHVDPNICPHYLNW